MKLNRNDLRRLIESEIENIDEDSLRYAHDDPGRQKFSAAQKAKTSCQECGSSMYEGDRSCSECGAMYEENETIMNEGDCGCAPSSSPYGSQMVVYNPSGCDACGSSPCACDEYVSPGEDDHKHHNNYMAKPSLYKVAKYAAKLLEMIPDGYELDDWQRTKIAQISDDISEVYHSLDYDDYTGDI